MAFIVFTKPREEQKAKENLERQGFRVFLPLCKEEGTHQIKLRPLFPRYLFVYPGELNWGKIKNTIGVSYIIKNDNIPCEIRESVVEEIKSRMVNGFIILESRTRRVFRKNQKIKIAAGKFADFEGLFVKREKDRIIALISMMGGQRYVKVPENSVA